MKALVKLALVASLAAGVTAQPHARRHRHQHAKKHDHRARLLKSIQPGSPVLQNRAWATVWDGPTVTSYQIDGVPVSVAEAEACLANGSCFVVGESEPDSVVPEPPSIPRSTSSVPSSVPTPMSTLLSTSLSTSLSTLLSTSLSTSVSTPVPTSMSTPAPTPSFPAAHEFFEYKVEPTSSPIPIPVSPTETPTFARALPTPSSPPPTPPASSSSSSNSSSGHSDGHSDVDAGVDADFPDGTIDCDAGLPSAYGAVPVTQLNNNGWAGILDVGLDVFTVGSKNQVKTFSVPTSGGLSAGMFGLYQCPPGYDMAQWPEHAQGATGQSIGGIWCGSDNKLHLTRASVTKKLCVKGAGGVQVVNKLSAKVNICKTAYPGTEAMVLANTVGPGKTYDLYNPYQNQSYQWQGASTSAQYYMNLKGLDTDIACVWTSPPPYAERAGNWAGVNLGTSVDSNGVTFLSIFYNSPTSNAALDYNIKLSGDVSNECTYTSSSHSFNPTNGNGCTVSARAGGTITVTLYD